MDLSKNIVLKENYSFLVANQDGFITESEHGLYNRDTRFLSRYVWNFGVRVQTLMLHNPQPDRLELHQAHLDDHFQVFAVKRNLLLDAQHLQEELCFDNTSLETQKLSCSLQIAADFADMFEARGWHHLERQINSKQQGTSLSFSYKASDGIMTATNIDLTGPFQLEGDTLTINLELPPKSSYVLKVSIQMVNPLEASPTDPISYDEWRKRFTIRLPDSQRQRVMARAIDDLRALLLFDSDGALPAAGIPWFVAAFGRDSLITSYLGLPYMLPEAKGTLAYLASKQAQANDDFRNAQPGKILHEMRYGELSRSSKTPHSPYYGTVDATPLFIILLHEVYQLSKDVNYLRDMKPHWEAALEWMTNYADLDGDGFLEFKAAEPGKGLIVQSWKDSADSMSHADGKLAQGSLAVSEVQGYAFAAYSATANFYTALGDPLKSSHWQDRAQTLYNDFQEAFWLADLQTYALALDGEKRPLRVQNSDAGHLLWSGIVPKNRAAQLVKTLFSPANWSGWGIRTLGKHEHRYNPVSYHNGSVWPHDNALIAAGLARYGFRNEARQIAEACFAIAASQSDLRLPELIGGYDRTEGPPVPYPAACRPQAWDAASLVYLHRFMDH